MKEQKFITSIIFSSNFVKESSKINCISRIDDKDKNLFVEENNKGQRWNLYSQIAIENDTLICAKEKYPLEKICHDESDSQPCTLKDTNEVVDIGYDVYSAS